MTLLLLFMLTVQWVGGKEFPNPRKEWRMCGMARPAFVCDPHFILPRGAAEQLDRIAAEFHKSTTCLCPKCEGGVSLGIFVSHNVSREAAAEYPNGRALAEMLRRRWALSPCGDDIVVLLLTQQNTSDFSLGPAVAALFPESTASRVVSECRVHFDSGLWYQGLESIANSFNDVLVRLQRQQKNSKPVFKNLMLGIGLGFGVLLALALMALCVVHRQNRKRTKSYCSDIYEGMPMKNNHRSSFNQEEHLEKLKRLQASDEEDEEDAQFEYKPSVRMNRQLSDVLEETSEDIEVLKRPSSIPVTEL